jgi:Asp-tRNA(Asn)/Glu-tRNA(Gln) amidotransferase A subunit family amidase
MNELCTLSATDALERIRQRKLTSEELTRACLERIEEREKDVDAWIHLDPEFSLEEARERDRSKNRGPIHGLPFAVKDIIDTADMPSRYGSPIYEAHQPHADAACVALTRAAGGVLLGKTVTTEFASRHPGKTRNPHDPTHTPGGSSSGSAAAVADFMVPMAFGTQTLGSVIRPASFCGCIGYKPSYGEISTTGVKENTGSFDTVGLFGRAVLDLPLFRAAVMGFQPKPLVARKIADLRIGLCRTQLWERAEGYTQTLVQGAARELSRAGARVADLDLGGPFSDFERMGRRVSDYEFSRALSWERNHHLDRMSPFQQQKMATWLEVEYEHYREAQDWLVDCRAYLDRAMKEFDILLTPSAPGEAPKGLENTGDTSFNILATWTYTPCVTLPLFKGPSGLPVGLQLVGHRHRDHRLFEIAQTVYEVLGGE